MYPARKQLGRILPIAHTASPITIFLFVSFLGGTEARADGGNPGMNAPGRQPLLVFYFDELARDGNLDTFQSRVEARYSEATLQRLVSAREVRARQAAVSALGLFGSFESNAVLASALADEDPTVQEMARASLWAVWFRADTPRNAERLRLGVQLRDRGRLDEAYRLASDIIEQAPDFAEAYNQRAITSFMLGHLNESATDCIRTLELNPYHIVHSPDWGSATCNSVTRTWPWKPFGDR